MSNYTLNFDFESINFKLNQYKNVFVFTGGISPKPSLAYKFLNNFGEPDFIIAADSGLESLDLFNRKLKKNYIPDVICGDMDSIKNKKLVLKYSALKKKKNSNLKNCDVIEFPVYKDFTDTELALMLAKKGRAVDSKITLIGGSGGRIDHLIAVYDLFSSEIAPDFWLTENQVLTLLKQGKSVKILTDKKTSPVSVLRLTDSREGGKIVSSGLEWKTDLFRTSGVPSLSNEISQDYFDKKLPATITAEEGNFAVAVFYSAKVDLNC